MLIALAWVSFACCLAQVAQAVLAPGSLRRWQFITPALVAACLFLALVLGGS